MRGEFYSACREAVYCPAMPRPNNSRSFGRTPSKNSHRPAARPKAEHRTRQSAHEYELEVLSGLEHVAETELQAVPLARDIRGLRFWYPGDPERLTRLRSAVAAYRVRAWDVPRPRGKRASLPVKPMALPPWLLIKLTMSLFT